MYLEHSGHRVLQKNWRTSWCEIDVVSQYKNCIYFNEVKYRIRSSAGDGLAYITPKKLQQMHRAAQSWVQQHKWQGEIALSVISVGGPNFVITDYIPSIE